MGQEYASCFVLEYQGQKGKFFTGKSWKLGIFTVFLHVTPVPPIRNSVKHTQVKNTLVLLFTQCYKIKGGGGSGRPPPPPPLQQS